MWAFLWIENDVWQALSAIGTLAAVIVALVTSRPDSANIVVTARWRVQRANPIEPNAQVVYEGLCVCATNVGRCDVHIRDVFFQIGSGKDAVVPTHLIWNYGSGHGSHLGPQDYCEIDIEKKNLLFSARLAARPLLQKKLWSWWFIKQIRFVIRTSTKNFSVKITGEALELFLNEMELRYDQLKNS